MRSQESHQEIEGDRVLIGLLVDGFLEEPLSLLALYRPADLLRLLEFRRRGGTFAAGRPAATWPGLRAPEPRRPGAEIP